MSLHIAAKCCGSDENPKSHEQFLIGTFTSESVVILTTQIHRVSMKDISKRLRECGTQKNITYVFFSSQVLFLNICPYVVLMHTQISSDILNYH